MKKNNDGTFTLSEKEIKEMVALGVSSAMKEFANKESEKTHPAVIKFAAGILESVSRTGSSVKQTITDAIDEISSKGEERLERSKEEDTQSEQDKALAEVLKTMSPEMKAALLKVSDKK